MVSDLVTAGGCANIDYAFFHSPDPEGQSPVQDHVGSDSSSSIIFGVLEAQLVVPKETGAGHQEGAIPEGQAGISQGVRLREFERVQVVWDGIIRCVLKVCM